MSDEDQIRLKALGWEWVGWAGPGLSIWQHPGGVCVTEEQAAEWLRRRDEASREAG